jgi:uncharacterized phage protein
MTIAIEQLIKIHDPRCVSIESLNVGRGRAILAKEQIIGAFAAAQHQHAVGYDLLMTKYRRDCRAELRLREAINLWIYRRPHPEGAVVACQLALNIVLERNLPAQVAYIAELLRKYGSRSGMTRKVVAMLRDQIKGLEIRRARASAGDGEYTLIGSEIEYLKTNIIIEKGALRTWAESESARTNICPRCRGVGKILRPHSETCDECNGAGRIIPSLNLLRKSMAMIGAEINPGDWASKYTPLVQECMNWLYVEESNAGIIISERIQDEKNL